MLGYTQACLISRIESAKLRKSERIISLNIVVNPSLASLITVGTRFKNSVINKLLIKNAYCGTVSNLLKTYII